MSKQFIESSQVKRNMHNYDITFCIFTIIDKSAFGISKWKVVSNIDLMSLNSKYYLMLENLNIKINHRNPKR